MTIIPNQPFGLGDAIFTQSLAHHIADGRAIIWPVFPQFVDQLTRAYPSITFVDWRTLKIDYERKDQYECEVPRVGKCTVLPFRWADAILRVPYNQCMRAKYDLYGLDFEMWRGRAIWVGDSKIELGSKILSDQKDAIHNSLKGYSFVNNIFGSDCKLKVNIPEQKYPIYLQCYADFGLFDWTNIIENATEIHTVSTSIIYLLEMLDLKAPEIHLYNRTIPGQGFDNVDYILKRHKYIFHG